MRTESLGRSYLALPDGAGPFPGVVVVHEASGLNDNIRDICGRFAAEGYAAPEARNARGESSQLPVYPDRPAKSCHEQSSMDACV